MMQALFIGHTYIDVTMIAEAMPQGDEKAVASDYSVSFGGNAVTAAFAAARLGAKVELLTTYADDWLGRMFMDMASRYSIPVRARRVRRSSLSFVLPKGARRAILRARDDAYLHPPPSLDLANCRVLHLDGHQADAALDYARQCRARGVLTSLDGGGLRGNTDDLLRFIDVAIVAERLCEQMNLTDAEMLEYLKARGCRIGGVTQGERGMLWYDERGEVSRLPALAVPDSLIVDTSGAGDVFHGAYVAAWLAHPQASWREHFEVARAASAFKIQRLGNEAGLPTLAEIVEIRRSFGEDEQTAAASARR